MTAHHQGKSSGQGNPHAGCLQHSPWLKADQHGIRVVAIENHHRPILGLAQGRSWIVLQAAHAHRMNGPSLLGCIDGMILKGECPGFLALVGPPQKAHPAPRSPRIREPAFPALRGEGQVKQAATNLKRFSDQIDHERSGTPTFLAVICGKGYGYRRVDGVLVVPIGAIGP